MTRSELIHIISESIRRQVLNEGDSRLNKVYRIISSEFDGLLDVNDVVRSHEYYVNGNPNTTWGEYLLYSLRHTFGLMSNSDVKYLPFVAKIAFSDEVGFEKRNNNGEEINNIRSIVQALKKDNGLFNTIVSKGVNTYSGLMEIMTPYLQAKEHEENDNIRNKEYTRNDDYDIVEVTSYEQAHEIGEYTKESNLCYTQSIDTWNQYTNNGTNRVFCLLKHGWKDMKPIADENAPYDDYGLSVIFVIFNKNGRLLTCNTRWNHAYSEGLHKGMSVDYSLNTEELSELIGENIYEALGIKESKINWGNAQEYLDKGYKPEDVFDKVKKFINGFAVVELGNKCNYVSTEGKLLSPNQWFDYLFAFENGFGQVKLNDKWNYIDTNGEILSPNQWFDFTYKFENGFGGVELNFKNNFINTEGKLLSPNQWFDQTNDFREGFAPVELNDKWNFIDTEGKILSPGQWFDYAYGFQYGFAQVAIGNKWNYIDKECKLLSPNQWFDKANYFHNGFGYVTLNGNEFYIDTEGKLYNKSPNVINEKAINKLKCLIKESIKKQLNEISIEDKYQKEQVHSKWNIHDFMAICQADPTYNREKDIVGKYTNWLLKKLQNIEQLEQIKAPLEWYSDGMKRGILQRMGIYTDINKYRSIDEFLRAMNNVMSNSDKQLSQTEYNNREKLKGQYEVIGENSDYEIIQPYTFEAERYFGSGTKWCTVANESYFNQYVSDYYDDEGQLFILYPKNGDKKLKMQFHFESNSYATYVDEVFESPVECIEKVFQNDKDKIERTIKLCREEFGYEKFKYVSLDSVQQLLDNGEKPNKIFDKISEPKDGISLVEIRHKFNWINSDGKLVSQNEWFSNARDFSEGVAVCAINDKWSWIKSDGNFLFGNKWFIECGSFSSGLAVFKDNDEKWKYIDKEGKVMLPNCEYIRAFAFCNGIAMVQNNHYRINYIDKNGDLISPTQWFSDGTSFKYGPAKIVIRKKNGRWIDFFINYLKPDGNYLFPNVSLESSLPFEADGTAKIRIKGIWYQIDKEGNILRNIENK